MCKAQTTTGGDNIDLSGQWRLALDYNNQGLQNEWYKYYSQWDSMSLPGTTDEAKKGRPESKRKYAYRGYAWYEKEVTIPENWRGKRVMFSIERAKGSMVCLMDNTSAVTPLISVNRNFCCPMRRFQVNIN